MKNYILFQNILMFIGRQTEDNIIIFSCEKLILEYLFPTSLVVKMKRKKNAGYFCIFIGLPANRVWFMIESVGPA